MPLEQELCEFFFVKKCMERDEIDSVEKETPEPRRAASLRFT
jgi:hypothetical protein